MKLCLASTANSSGRYLEEVLKSNSHNVFRTRTNNAGEIEDLLGQYDFLVLNFTTSLNRRIIENVVDRSRIVEMSPAKTPMMRYRGEIISLSILRTYNRATDTGGSILTVIEDISREGTREIVEELFGTAMESMSKTAEEHDKLISELLVKPYILSLLSRKISDLDFTPTTPEYDMLLDLSRSIDNYNIDTVRDLLRNNPQTGEIFAGMEASLKRVWNELSNY